VSPRGGQEEEGAVPPSIPGTERYWRNARGSTHRARCPYTKNQHMTEWVAARGSSPDVLNRLASQQGRVVKWCFRCYPDQHPSGPDRWRKPKSAHSLATRRKHASNIPRTTGHLGPRSGA
jgi:hypothetical protein